MDLVAKDCPFCGRPVDPDDFDTLYPTGIRWRDDDIGRVYLSARSKEKHDGKVFKLICNTLYSGCGAEMYGDTVEEVLKKWNTRAGE